MAKAQTLTSLNQDDKIAEVVALGYTVTEISDDEWLISIREQKTFATVGDIAGKRAEMEGYANQLFTAKNLHFVIEASMKGLVYRLGVGTDISSSITASQS